MVGLTFTSIKLANQTAEVKSLAASRTSVKYLFHLTSMVAMITPLLRPYCYMDQDITH